MASPDPLSKAANAILKPALARHGIRPYSRRMSFRICGKIAQFLEINTARWSQDRLAVIYFIFPLVPPRKFIGSVLADSFPCTAPEASADSLPEDLMRMLVEKARIAVEAKVLPVFDRTATLPGYINVMKGRAGVSNPHNVADTGVALVCNGSIEEGRAYLKRAEQEYRTYGASFSVGERPNWPDDCADEMSRLLTAIEGGTHASLLEDWTRESMVNLKIDKKWKPPADGSI